MEPRTQLLQTSKSLKVCIVVIIMIIIMIITTIISIIMEVFIEHSSPPTKYSCKRINWPRQLYCMRTKKIIIIKTNFKKYIYNNNK